VYHGERVAKPPLPIRQTEIYRAYSDETPGAPTFIVKVHRGERRDERADDLADLGMDENHSLWNDRATRLIYSFLDKRLNWWTRDTWTP
jgi:hypothetical protein